MPLPPQFTSLQTRQLVKFFDPGNTSNFFIPQINPMTITRTPGNVRKYVKTTNGTSIIQGDREYPPTEIAIDWTTIDDSDLQSLRLFTALSPVVFIDNNDQGFFGVYDISSANQQGNVTKKVWAVKSSFLVLAPYNGQTTNLLTLTPPALSAGTLASGGYIPNATTLYFWSTVFTPWGESTVSSSLSVTTSGANQYIPLSFTAPTSGFYRKTRIYWNTSNNSSTATLLTELLAGQAASFTVYGPYATYSTTNPPSYGTAFTGYFSGSLWTPLS